MSKYRIGTKMVVRDTVEIPRDFFNPRRKLKKGKIYFVRHRRHKRLIGTVVQLVRYDMGYLERGTECPIDFFSFVEGSEYESLFKIY